MAAVFPSISCGGGSMPTEKGFFAERLKVLREQTGLSQPVLAERSGIGVSTIRQFEYGRREPTYGTLIKLTRGLGVPLSAFEQAAAESQPAPKKRRAQAGKGK